jgi:hypothetical protein
MQWKKHAIDSPDFEDYKQAKRDQLEKLQELACDYIKSEKGRICVAYESKRVPTALCIGAIALALNLPGLLFIWIANAILKNNRDVTLTEWVIQRIFRLRPFSSIKPSLHSSSEGTTEISW